MKRAARNGWMVALIGLVLVGCGVPSPQATPVATPANPTEIAFYTATIQPATSTPTGTAANPTAKPSPAPVFTSTIAVTPTLDATPMMASVTGKSIGAWNFSPDSRWLPYIDFDNQTLHFYDTTRNSICDFPIPIDYKGPYRFLAWLPDGRVVVQAANDVETGLPCSDFATATPQEILALDWTDPSFSPGGRFQAVETVISNTQGLPNQTTTIKEAATGKTVMSASYIKMAQGGGTITGYWLDRSNFLIPFTGDQGPLLLTPGKPVTKIASDIFHLPLKPGTSDFGMWLARVDVDSPPGSSFHLMLIPTFTTSNHKVSNPLQIYHSETGEVETLPYLVNQGAFSNDGHWLMVTTDTPQGQKVLIRPIDPPGTPLQLFTEEGLILTWSPDGGKYYQVSEDQTTITVHAFPGNVLLGRWQASGYEVSPSWSPDGKFLAVWARKPSDDNLQGIFVIPIPGRSP